MTCRYAACIHYVIVCPNKYWRFHSSKKHHSLPLHGKRVLETQIVCLQAVFVHSSFSFFQGMSTSSAFSTFPCRDWLSPITSQESFKNMFNYINSSLSRDIADSLVNTFPKNQIVLQFWQNTAKIWKRLHCGWMG